MAKPVIMPKFGMDQTESAVVEWLKQEGDPVEKGEPLVLVMTDKVNMEVEAPASGILAKICAAVDETVPVTSVIAYIAEEGESLPEGDAPEAAVADHPTPEPVAEEESAAPSGVPITPVAARLATTAGVDLNGIRGSGPGGRITKQDVQHLLSPATGRVRATPAARRLAREHALELETIEGSGPRGRIQEADVLARATAPAPEPEPLPTPSPAVEEKVEVVRLSGMRRLIARRMLQSVQTIPTFTLSTEIDTTSLQQWRKESNEYLKANDQAPISLTAAMLKAVAWALKRHRYLNAHCLDEEIHLFERVHLGVAVDREQGLIVPVIRDVDGKGVAEIGQELKALSERARADRLAPEEVQGATFTVSNLGMFAVDHFTAIVNPPQVGILALGRITPRLIPVDGAPLVRPIMTATLSADHRVVDGAMGARFMNDVAAALAAPGLLLL